MRHLIMIAMLAAGSAGLSDMSMAAEPTTPYNLTAANKRDIITQIKDELFDGESARWRWPKHVPEFGLYCGFVNAKNRLGAYTGFKPFMVIGGVPGDNVSVGKYLVANVKFSTNNEDDTVTGVVKQMCSSKGYDTSSVPLE